jgi:hypothetical protein
MRFLVLTAARIKITGVWNVAPGSLVEVDRRFRGAYCLHHQGDDLFFLEVAFHVGLLAICVQIRIHVNRPTVMLSKFLAAERRDKVSEINDKSIPDDTKKVIKKFPKNHTYIRNIKQRLRL